MLVTVTKWFSDFRTEMGGAIYLLAFGVGALLLALWLAFSSYRRTGDRSDLVTIAQTFGVIPALALISCLHVIVELGPIWVKVPVSLLMVTVGTAYLVASASRAVVRQSNRAYAVHCFSYLWWLPVCLFLWVILTPSSEALVKWPLTLVRPLGIAAGWLLAPLFLRKIRADSEWI